MIITCANCETSYELDENLIKETGSKVRCKSCSHVFTVYPPRILDSIEPEPDLDLEPVSDEADGPSDADAGMASEDADVFNFPDIENLLETQDAAGEEDLIFDDDEPELNIEFDEVDATAGSADSKTEKDLDFLDLSEIEDMLSTDMDFGADNLKITDNEPDLDLDMEADEEVESAANLPAGVAENLDLDGIEEMLAIDKDADASGGPDLVAEEPALTLDIEEGFEDIFRTSDDKPLDEDDSLDLSDIEKMLDTEGLSGAHHQEATEEDLELSLDSDADDEPGLALVMDSEDDETAAAGDENISEDLILEMEGLDDLKLAVDDDEEADLHLEMEDLDLKLDEETPEPAAVETMDLDEDGAGLKLDEDLDLVLDLDEEDDLLLAPDEAKEKTVGLTPAAVQSRDASDEGEFALDLSDLEEEELAEAPAAASKKQPHAPAMAFAMGDGADAPKPRNAITSRPEPEKKSRALTYLLLVLLILFGGVYGGLSYLNHIGMDWRELPYIDRVFAPAGAVIPVESTINGEFYENGKAGLLLVVTGEVENTFRHGRSHIRITAELLTAAKKTLQSETVYGGNIIDKADLENKALVEINMRLQKKFGDKNANVNVKSGARLPFMVVFSNLPDNMNEFRVKVMGSDPVQK